MQSEVYVKIIFTIESLVSGKARCPKGTLFSTDDDKVRFYSMEEIFLDNFVNYTDVKLRCCVDGYIGNVAAYRIVKSDLPGIISVYNENQATGGHDYGSTTMSNT